MVRYSCCMKRMPLSIRLDKGLRSLLETGTAHPHPIPRQVRSYLTGNRTSY